MNSFENMKKTIVLGVTSGIAAYKSLELIKLLRKEGLEVFVIMTESATKMVSIKDFEKASGNKVSIQLFEKGFDYNKILKTRRVDHIDLADKADVFVIAPATANMIAKIAYGLADDFLTTTVLATQAPVIVCASMNVHMWENLITQANVEKLRTMGYQIIEPEEGALACGYEGKGRSANVEAIRDEIMSLLSKSTSLKGKKVLVTAGGTIENIDDVRFITNKSSGKMGVAIGEECYLRGADVLLLRANSSVKSRYPIKEATFDTADELFTLIKKNVKAYDVCYHTAAVSDFTVKKLKGKISSKKAQTLELVPSKKICDEIKKLNPKIKLIAFKAEVGKSDSELLKIAKEKLKECGADGVVANEVGKPDRGFQAETNEVIIVLRNGQHKKIPLTPKREIAKAVVDFVIDK